MGVNRFDLGPPGTNLMAEKVVVRPGAIRRHDAERRQSKDGKTPSRNASKESVQSRGSFVRHEDLPTNQRGLKVAPMISDEPEGAKAEARALSIARDEELDMLGHRPGRTGSKEPPYQRGSKNAPMVIQRGSKDLAQHEKDRAEALARRPSKDEIARVDSKGNLVRRDSKESVGSAATGFSKDPQYLHRRKSIREVLLEEENAPIGRSKFAIERNLDPERFADRKFLDDVFMCYDPNGDGTGSLTSKEFVQLCQDIGLELTKSQVKGLMKQLDLNGNESIEIEEFHFFFNKAKGWDDLRKHAKDMCGSKNAFVRKLFEEFKDPRGDGINARGLQQIVSVCGLDKGPEPVSKDEVKTLFARLDARGSGHIGLKDVEFLLSNVEARPQLKEWLSQGSKANALLLKHVFHAFDSSQQGVMSEADLLAAARFMGLQITEKGVGNLLRRVDVDSNGTVELQEFLDFFGQVRSTEEMLEELEVFKQANVRRQYVMGAAIVLAAALVAGGLVLQAGDANTAGVAMLVGGIMIGTVVLSPIICLPIWTNLIIPYFSECSKGKFYQVFIVCVFALVGLIGVKVVMPKTTGWTLIPIIILGVFVAGAVLLGGIAKCCGGRMHWFEEPTESDLESPKSGPAVESAPGPLQGVDLEANKPPKTKAAKW